MKILQIVDVPHWAIGHLSQSIVENNPHLKFKVLYVHPKHVEKHLLEVKEWIDWADIIDYQYWNTARQLMELLPEIRKKPSLLTHHNEKDLLSADWKDVSLHIAETKKSVEILTQKYPNTKLIPLAVDLEFWTYKEKLSLDDHRPVVGYTGRIVPWKGLREIAQACYDLGYILKLMGKFDKPDYWNSIPPEVQQIIDMEFMDCDDQDRKDFYHDIDVYVGFSTPGRETGPLGLLEAMASGTPVLTTPSGVAADICEDQENSIVTAFENYQDLKNNLRMLVNNPELREKIRRNAWQTVKNYNVKLRAWEYEKAYHSVFDPVYPLVSVIIPCYNAKENVLKILNNLANDNYPHLEAVVSDDGSIDGTMEAVKEWADHQTKLIVKIVKTMEPFTFAPEHKTYNLAKARNLAVIEAHGEYLMFCDSRMLPDPNAVTTFFSNLCERPKEEKIWLFGNKGTGKRTFVENFSFIRRKQFIEAGMFNERIDRYGGMSQECRQRFLSQGFKMILEEGAIAEQMSGSHMNSKRRSDIIAMKLKLWKMGLV